MNGTFVFVRGAASRLRRYAIVAVAGLAGCSSIAVFFGLRERLADEPVTAIAASLDGGPALAPGRSARLVIVADTADGKRLTTVGPGHGKVLFDSFMFRSDIVGVDADGVVSLPDDPRASQGRMPHVHIDVAGHPGVSAELDVPLRYNVAFTADFSGHAGADGFSGTDGSTGINGSDGAVDPFNANAPRGSGGNGGNGGDGGDGEDGGDGQPGGTVQVWLRLEAGPQRLLQARVAGGGDERLYLIDPDGGSLAINASGGRAGWGGRGGRGGQGGTGGNGNPSGVPGFNGHDGRNGFDGRPGAAGSFAVVVDPVAQPYLDRLQLSNKSGSGLPGPAPRISVEPLAPLW